MRGHEQPSAGARNQSMRLREKETNNKNQQKQKFHGINSISKIKRPSNNVKMMSDKTFIKQYYFFNYTADGIFLKWDKVTSQQKEIMRQNSEINQPFLKRFLILNVLKNISF